MESLVCMKKALGVTYQYTNLSLVNSSFSKSASIHYRNINYLLTEIHKAKMGLSPSIMGDIFGLSENSSYNERCGVTVNRRNTRTNKFGFETVSTIGAILWNDVPAELKNAESLNKFFKQKIKLWSPNVFPCKICRKLIKNLGHI